MLIYQNTFENIKTSNCNFPIEDQYYANESVAIVADGITRDPIGVEDFSQITFEEMKEKYPRPSGGELASKVIVDTFKKERETLKERLIECNKQVQKLNEKYIKKCDYLENDYYGAVAACVHIENHILNYAYICDCGIIIYDQLGNIKFQTEDDKEKYSDPCINKIGIPWHLKEARKIVRKEYRNNLENIQYGKCVSYGALTGEENALYFIKEGKISLNKNDFVVVYSDGMTNLLHEPEFIKRIINFNKEDFENYIEKISVSDYEKYGKEKTIVIMKHI